MRWKTFTGPFMEFWMTPMKCELYWLSLRVSDNSG